MGFLDDIGAAPEETPKRRIIMNTPLDPAEPKPPSFLQNIGVEEPPPQPSPPPAPEWSEVPIKALVNTPESAWEAGKNLVHPFLHPIDTAKSMGQLGLGLLEKGHKAGIFPAIPQFEFGEDTSHREDMADAMGKMLKDRYGSEENIRRTLAHDPVGVLADLSAVLTGGGSVASRAPGVVGKLGEAANTAGRVVDPLNAVIQPAKLAGHSVAATMGYSTGSGMRNVEEAAKAGFDGGEAAKTFKHYQSGQGTPEEFVNYAMNAKKNLLKERGLDYETGMIPVKNSNQQLSFADIGQAMTDAHNITRFKGKNINQNAGVVKTLNDLDDLIIQWVRLPPADFHTPAGFDALKKSIGTLRDKFEVGSPEWAAANRYYKATDHTIRKQVPEYGQVMKDYKDFSTQIEQIEKTLSLPRDEGKLNFDTALRKMQSILRRNVNTNLGQRERLVDVLEASGAPHLKAAIAGMGLSSPEAHGLARLVPALRTMGWRGFTEAAVSLGLASPKIAGNAAYRAGRLASPLKYTPFLNRGTYRALHQAGRATDGPYRDLNPEPQKEARGGAIERALRVARRK